MTKKAVKRTHKLKTIYTHDINGKKLKKTFYIPLDWNQEKVDKAVQIVKAISPKLLQEMTDRNILTYCVIEYVNGNSTTHYERMKRELKKVGI